jgi:hypothetical protein
MINWNITINTMSSELLIPAFTLPVGVYKLTLTVSTVSPGVTIVSASVFVQIIAADVVAFLIQFGTSMISNAHDVDLQLDPGRFSVDPERSTFDASVSQHEKWAVAHSIVRCFRTGTTTTFAVFTTSRTFLRFKELN